MGTSGEEKPRVLGALGMSRRDLFRRGAVLGGALVWVSPAIRSITSPAYAQTPSVRVTSCCACIKRTKHNNQTLCVEDLTLVDCQDFCGAGNLESYLVAAECNSAGNCVPIS
jgi:hypothetical protein